MPKLSANKVQQSLLEAEAEKKATYERAKKNSKPGLVGKLSDPSTKITNIEQIKANPLQKVTDDKGKPFVEQSDLAGVYADKMEHGIFTAKDANEKSPRIPSVDKMTPNQKTKQKKVSPDMSLTKDGQNKKTFWPQADFAQNYVDEMPQGDIYSEDTHDGAGKTPKAKDLGGTTRPKSHEVKKPDMDRWPHKDVRGPSGPATQGTFQSGPSDAPKKPSWEKVKGGTNVRVNESVKARFGIVSEEVLKKVCESYSRFGYKVVVESNPDVAWKRDKRFLSLLGEAVSAKFNHLAETHGRYRNAAFKRLFELSKPDYNDLYESRDAFIKTIQAALGQIEKIAEQKYRDSLAIFEGKARIVHEGAVKDVTLITEARDEQMALRSIRHTLRENFGLTVDIQHIFVDGNKFSPKQIQEWAPRVKLA